MWSWLWLLAVQAQAQDCLRVAAPGEVAATLEEAEAAFAQLEEAAFLDRMQRASLLVPCVAEPLSPGLSATYHRMQGILLYSTEREDLAMGALAAARVLQPDYQLPDSLFPEGHELRVAFDELPLEEGASWRPPRPKQGRLLFDGDERPARPTERPTLFQHLDDAGRPLRTAYVQPAEPLPTYAAVPRRRNRLLAVGAGALAASAAMYGGAWATRSAFYGSEEPTLEELQRQRALTNGLWGGALATAGVGAVTIGGAILVSGGP